ncbi:MAG: 23S rRNA (uracil(1939)-C(5))-methyltransferase RlmD, partial [Clostridia bacterium]|nr:23S rRNA (uracil(1939)-C(5))-methyltransferase RlmD [Clostridia bacterium]
GTLHPDVVILDPPRKGCDEVLLRFLAARVVPRIVYVSCNPDSLARDVARLVALGYVLDKVTPVDLFPRTGHVESVVCLTRKEA